jgi:hypothetical protein
VEEAGWAELAAVPTARLAPVTDPVGFEQAAALAGPNAASARPAPIDGPAGKPASVHIPASGGRTDQQFWGEATWLDPLSGLNLDRSSVAD